MTNEEIKNGFNEVYNQFWIRYKNHPIALDDDAGWDQLVFQVGDLANKYPFMKDTILNLLSEIEKRAGAFKSGD